LRKVAAADRVSMANTRPHVHILVAREGACEV